MDADLSVQRGLPLLRRVGERRRRRAPGIPGRSPGIRVARHVLVLDTPQAIHLGLVQAGRGTSQEQRKLLLRLREVPAMVLALGGLEVEREGEIVVRAPQIVAHQLQPRREIPQCGLVRGRGLGLQTRAQIEPGECQALRRVRDQVAPEIQVVDQVEDPLLARFGIRARQQQPAHRQVHQLLLLGGDQRVGRLLDPVVEKGVRRALGGRRRIRPSSIAS